MIDKLKHASSPSPGSNIRRSKFPSSMTGLDGEQALIVRRRRLRLRRIKSVALIKSKPSDMGGGAGIITGENGCTKRKRNTEFSLSKREKISQPALATEPPSEEDRLPETEVIIAAKASYESVEGTVREGIRKVTCCSHGSVSVIGRRREMEDAVAVEQGFLERGSKKFDFFGVYDGHGGSLVAHACSRHLHSLVAKQVEEDIDYANNKLINWEKVMTLSFKKMDDYVNKGDPAGVAMIGSTAVVAVVGEEEMVVANCGDSRAVLSRGGMAVALSDDHKPDRPDELERIQSCGGKVINWNGQRVLGVLATSRSIGDKCLKPFVIPDPEVRVITRTDEDEFLILASDGLWDVISNDIACQLVRKCLASHTVKNPAKIIGQSNGREMADSGHSSENADSRAARATALLAEMAFAHGSRDNISIIVIELRRLPK